MCSPEVTHSGDFSANYTCKWYREELWAFWRTGLGFKMLTKWRNHLEKIRGDSEKDEHKVVNLGENNGLPRYKMGDGWLSSSSAERGWSWWWVDCESPGSYSCEKGKLGFISKRVQPSFHSAQPGEVSAGVLNQFSAHSLQKQQNTSEVGQKKKF